MTEKYELLIEPVFKPRNRRVFLFFRPKEIIQDSPYELKLKITNKCGTCFPGGIMSEIELLDIKTQVVDSVNDIAIPEISSQDCATVYVGVFSSFSDGQIALSCVIKAKDKKGVMYYQKNKIENKNELLNLPVWLDFLPITSRYEINQRYTNYILLVMTSILVLFTLVLVYKDVLGILGL